MAAPAFPRCNEGYRKLLAERSEQKQRAPDSVTIASQLRDALLAQPALTTSAENLVSFMQLEPLMLCSVIARSSSQT
jgi:hypothetical protein